jgi:hypothetical protein
MSSRNAFVYYSRGDRPTPAMLRNFALEQGLALLECPPPTKSWRSSTGATRPASAWMVQAPMRRSSAGCSRATPSAPSCPWSSSPIRATTWCWLRWRAVRTRCSPPAWRSASSCCGCAWCCAGGARRQCAPDDAPARHRPDRARHRQPHPARRGVRRLLRGPRPLQGVQRPLRLQRGRPRHPHAVAPAARRREGLHVPKASSATSAATTSSSTWRWRGCRSSARRSSRSSTS